MLLFSSFTKVKANEYSEVTQDVEIKYKWYKEIIEGDYYPLKEEKEGYLIDEFNIKYGDYSLWSEENCRLSDKYYLKDYRIIRVYEKIRDVRYVKLENFRFNNNIKIYQNNQPLNYDILYNKNNMVKIDLKQEYRSETLTFFIENSQNYEISLYTNKEFTDYIISKQITNETLLIPDKTWITQNTIFNTTYTEEIYNNSDLTIKIREYNVCKYREKYVYKYQIKKEYYDDEYHENVDGYIKDTNDYKVLYKGEPITNNVEIIKERIVKDPQIEYIYIPKENTIEKNDSSKEIQEENCHPKVKAEIKERIIYKVPKKVYLIIILPIIIFLIMKLLKKMSTKTFSKYCRKRIKK